MVSVTVCFPRLPYVCLSGSPVRNRGEPADTWVCLEGDFLEPGNSEVLSNNFCVTLVFVSVSDFRTQEGGMWQKNPEHRGNN